LFYIKVSLSFDQTQNAASNYTSPDHDFGGHFAGLDNPAALIEDLREIGKYWE
jgi:hypothetical protein